MVNKVTKKCRSAHYRFETWLVRSARNDYNSRFYIATFLLQNNSKPLWWTARPPCFISVPTTYMVTSHNTNNHHGLDRGWDLTCRPWLVWAPSSHAWLKSCYIANISGHVSEEHILITSLLAVMNDNLIHYTILALTKLGALL